MSGTPIGPWRSARRRLARAISASTGSSRPARASHADTVHPGYGFLSENWRFAEACQRAGLTFVGPSPDAIRRMGDETEARRLMAAAGVPVVPGSHETTAHAVEAERVACEIGYPVMLKAAAGGGGIGMARVDKAGELPTAFAMATRRAQAVFGRPDVYVERYLERPRHVEIQVFGDGAGTVVHLHERDCSIQRRHQKLVEESPAPNLAPTIKDGLARARRSREHGRSTTSMRGRWSSAWTRRAASTSSR